MTPEEYLDKKKAEQFNGRESYYTVSLDDAVKAVEMTRNEKKLLTIYHHQRYTDGSARNADMSTPLPYPHV